jgi:NifU-like protein involved in Fe-S cluster formation
MKPGVSADEILEQLGGMPEEEVHCAHLAAETLRKAIEECLSKKRAFFQQLK